MLALVQQFQIAIPTIVQHVLALLVPLDIKFPQTHVLLVLLHLVLLIPLAAPAVDVQQDSL